MKHSVPPSEVVRVSRNRRFEKSRWLIHELLPARGRACMFGAPKTGKSFLACLMAHCVSTGTPFMGRAVRKASVLFMAFEDAEGIDMRMGVYEQHIGMDRQIFLQKNMLPFTRPGPGSLRPITRYIEDVIQEPEASDIGLIVIDTVARSMVGSENDGEDWAFYQESVDLLALNFPQACVLLIHHENKSADHPTPRGHTSLPAHMDSILRVTRKGGDRGKLIVEGMKNAASGYEFNFKLEDVEADLLDMNGALFLHKTKIPVLQTVSANAPIQPPAKLTRKDRTLAIVYRMTRGGKRIARNIVQAELAKELNIDITNKRKMDGHGRVFREDWGDLVDEGVVEVDISGGWTLTSAGEQRAEEEVARQKGHLNGKAKDSTIRAKEPESSPPQP